LWFRKFCFDVCAEETEDPALRHHNSHLTLKHFRSGATHFETSFLSPALIGQNNIET
jgi:hypothetical protein